MQQGSIFQLGVGKWIVSASDMEHSLSATQLDEVACPVADWCAHHDYLAIEILIRPRPILGGVAPRPWRGNELPRDLAIP